MVIAFIPQPIYIISGLIVVLENIWTMVIISVVPNLRTKSNIIILSLAVVDFITGLNLVFAQDISDLLLKLQLTPQMYCVVMVSQMAFGLHTSVMHLLTLTLDR